MYALVVIVVNMLSTNKGTEQNRAEYTENSLDNNGAWVRSLALHWAKA